MLWKDRLWQLFLVIVGAGVLGVTIGACLSYTGEGTLQLPEAQASSKRKNTSEIVVCKVFSLGGKVLSGNYPHRFINCYSSNDDQNNSNYLKNLEDETISLKTLADRGLKPCTASHRLYLFCK